MAFVRIPIYNNNQVRTRTTLPYTAPVAPTPEQQAASIDAYLEKKWADMLKLYSSGTGYSWYDPYLGKASPTLSPVLTKYLSDPTVKIKWKADALAAIKNNANTLPWWTTYSQKIVPPGGEVVGGMTVGAGPGGRTQAQGLMVPLNVKTLDATTTPLWVEQYFNHIKQLEPSGRVAKGTADRIYDFSTGLAKAIATTTGHKQFSSGRPNPTYDSNRIW